MDPYWFTVVLGGVGLLAMAGAGVAHFSGGGAHSAHGHAGQSHDVHIGAGHTAAHGHVVPVGARSHHGHGSRSSGAKSLLLSLMSPRVFFGLLFGFGVTGVLVHPFLAGALVPVAAIAGALVLEFGVVAPMWRFFLRFGSKPAQTFDSALMSEARATSSFDGNGEGLVVVEVDGHVVQCLGRLRDADRALGVRVRAGDVLRVEDVDSARQRCTVSYVGHAVSDQ